MPDTPQPLPAASALLQRISLGEDTTLELKSLTFKGDKVTDPHRNGMADELAAMANTASGTVVLGVDDDAREITGIPQVKLDAAENWLLDICNDSITPPLDCIIKKMALPDGNGNEKYVIVIEVPRSLFVHNSPGGYFRRIGSAKCEMAPDALARLFQQRSQTRLNRFDEQAVHGTLPESLNPKLWQRFRTPLSPKSDAEFLEKMKLTVTDGEGASRATVSGVLMASETSHEWLPGAFIQAVCYCGIDRTRQLDTKDITGPLDEQIRDACKFVERNMRVYAIKAPNRIETPQFSINAVFEAVTNAVAHRDYSIHGSKIRLHIFSDRLELFSPGTLPNTMSIESISQRQSARNELLSSLLARCPMNVDAYGSQRNFIMDKRGEGVPIILTESEQLSGRRPEYRLLDEAELMLTIFAAPSPHGGAPDA